MNNPFITPPRKSEFLARKIDQVQRDLERARSAGSWTAMSNLHRLDLELDGEFRAALELEATPRPDQSDPLASLLYDVRRLRRSAEVKGSMVAAGKLLEREQSILSELREEARKRDERERTAQDAGAYLAKLEETLQRVPPALARQLLERLASRAQA